MRKNRFISDNESHSHVSQNDPFSPQVDYVDDPTTTQKPTNSQRPTSGATVSIISEVSSGQMAYG